MQHLFLSLSLSLSLVSLRCAACAAEMCLTSKACHFVTRHMTTSPKLLLHSALSVSSLKADDSLCVRQPRKLADRSNRFQPQGSHPQAASTLDPPPSILTPQF